MTIGLFINMGGMWLGYDIIGINEWITKIIMTFVVLVYNFVTRKVFIFKKDKTTESEAAEEPAAEEPTDEAVTEETTEEIATEETASEEIATEETEEKAETESV